MSGVWFATESVRGTRCFGDGAGAFHSHRRNLKFENLTSEIELKLHSGESRCHDLFFLHSIDVSTSLLNTFQPFPCSFGPGAGGLPVICFLTEKLRNSGFWSSPKVGKLEFAARETFFVVLVCLDLALYQFSAPVRSGSWTSMEQNHLLMADEATVATMATWIQFDSKIV